MLGINLEGYAVSKLYLVKIGTNAKLQNGVLSFAQHVMDHIFNIQLIRVQVIK